MDERRCSRCKRFFPPTTEYFGRCKRGFNGCHSWCRKCLREYDRQRAKTPERRERERIRSKERYNDPEYKLRHSQYHRDRYQNDTEYREKIIQNGRTRYADFALRQKKRKHDNEYHRLVRVVSGKPTAHRRRTREKLLPDTLTPKQWGECLKYFDHSCAVCGKKADFWTVIAMDHWIPLSKTDLSPGNVALNVVPLCHARKNVPAGVPTCNLSKHDRMPDEWLVIRFGETKAKRILKRVNNYFLWVRERQAIENDT